MEYNTMSNYKVLRHLPRTFHLIAAACARSLTERSLILTRRYLLSTLMSPLLLVCDDDCDAVDPGKKVVVEEAGEASNPFFILALGTWELFPGIKAIFCSF